MYVFVRAPDLDHPPPESYGDDTARDPVRENPIPQKGGVYRHRGRGYSRSKKKAEPTEIGIVSDGNDHHNWDPKKQRRSIASKW